jgi:aspartyl-tRNA(Asn)/glutamyl-tRNA(Gln) amidotransferase subunit A
MIYSDAAIREYKMGGSTTMSQPPTRRSFLVASMMRTAESFAESKNFDPLGTRNTSPFHAFGLPAITVPCGFSAAGLPIGLQISGAPFAESTVLALAHAYERETTWHTRRPKLTSI